jgi:hypothetical protein
MEGGAFNHGGVGKEIGKIRISGLKIREKRR